MSNKYKQESKKQEISDEPRSVRQCSHPQRKRRQESAKKVLADRTKRTDQEKLNRLDKLLGKNKGAKKERAKLKYKAESKNFKESGKHEPNKQKSSKKIHT
jgi:uncharacterized protein YdiU (UPF0061 family)